MQLCSFGNHARISFKGRLQKGYPRNDDKIEEVPACSKNDNLSKDFTAFHRKGRIYIQQWRSGKKKKKIQRKKKYSDIYEIIQQRRKLLVQKLRTKSY